MPRGSAGQACTGCSGLLPRDKQCCCSNSHSLACAAFCRHLWKAQSSTATLHWLAHSPCSISGELRFDSRRPTGGAAVVGSPARSLQSCVNEPAETAARSQPQTAMATVPGVIIAIFVAAVTLLSLLPLDRRDRRTAVITTNVFIVAMSRIIEIIKNRNKENVKKRNNLLFSISRYSNLYQFIYSSLFSRE